MRPLTLCLLACLLVGCGDPGPKVRAYTAATDKPLAGYVDLMGEYAHLSNQVKERMDKVAMTPELAARMAEDLQVPLDVLSKRYDGILAELRKAPPAPKQAADYHKSVEDMFAMMGKMLGNYRELTLEMKKGRSADVNKMAKLSREMESYSAAATQAMQDAQKQRQELDAKYPAQSQGE